MPLPSDAARVSLLAESSEDEHEISAPRRMANPLAHAPDAELDALVRALRSKKPSDRKRLEAEEREAARARVRVELMSHVHRLKRDGVVAFPAGFDADAKARAEARRARVGGEGTEQTRTDDTPRAARARREPRETGTVSAAAAAAADPPRDDATSRDASDADARSDASGDLRDLDGSFERFRVDVDEIARPRSVSEPGPAPEPEPERENAPAKRSSVAGEDDGNAETFREPPSSLALRPDAEQLAALAAIDDALATVALVSNRDVSLDRDVSSPPEKPLEPFEPFGGADADARLTSVDARLKTFAAGRG